MQFKRVEFTSDAGRVFNRGNVIICDEKTASYFAGLAKITDYTEPVEKVEKVEKKSREVNEYGK